MLHNKNILKILAVTTILLLSVVKVFPQTTAAECADCTKLNPAGGQNTTLTIGPGEVVCFTENRTFEFESLTMTGGTICIAKGVSVTFQNNVETTLGTTINLEIHGTLQFNQTTTMHATVIANIYETGVLRSGPIGDTDFYFNGSGNNYILNYGEMNMGALSFQNLSGNYYFDNFGLMSITRNVNIESKITKFKNNLGGEMILGQNFGMKSGTDFYNCGTITAPAGFNMGGGKILNTGYFNVTGNVSYGFATSLIENYGTFNVTNGNIQMATGSTFYNEGVTRIKGKDSRFSGDNSKITGPKTGLGKLGYFYFDNPALMNNGGSIGPNLNFKNENGVSSLDKMFTGDIRMIEPSTISWDCEAADSCAAPKQESINLCPDFDGNLPKYWMGRISEDFDNDVNWNIGIVPKPGEDVEFATAANNNNNPAINNLKIPEGATKTIGSLTNETDLATIIPANTELIVNEDVVGSETEASKLRIESGIENPTGTLIFKKPALNTNVLATIQFYNQAYDCKDCGFYRRSWQYFGIPVLESAFPYADVDGEETVNQWVEPFNGNKWQPAPYEPDTQLKAFKGYEITNSVTVKPTELYNFGGTLNVGNASVPLTRTSGVNYPGVNLVGNSYTAAIPIKETSFRFPAGVQKTLYLFNTGTRDEWRKLDGSAINQQGYRSGQYLAVPANLGGTANFPDRIPSMHAFMLLTDTTFTGGNLEINYSTLVKNDRVNRGDGTQIVTRSAGNNASLPNLVIDVIGEQSADRVWIFNHKETTYGFDNGWDARKIGEGDIAQIYVVGSDMSRLQVATTPANDSIMLGFEPEANGTYRLEYLLSKELAESDIYLHDNVTGAVERITNGGSYTFEAKEGDMANRFTLSAFGSDSPFSADERLISVNVTEDGKIEIKNESRRTCSLSLWDLKGKHIQNAEVDADEVFTLTPPASGTYLVRIQNAVVNDVRKVTIN